MTKLGYIKFMLAGRFYIVNLINEHVIVVVIVNIVNLLIYYVFHCSNLVTSTLRES